MGLTLLVVAWARRLAAETRQQHGMSLRAGEVASLATALDDVAGLIEDEEASLKDDARWATDALAASEQRGRHNALVIKSASGGIFASDTQGNCTSANPAAARMLGYEVAELVGKNLHALIHHSYPDGSPYPVGDCPMQLAGVGGRTARVDGEVFWRRDGSRLPVEYSASPLTEHGRVRGVVVTFVDAGDRREHSDEVERNAAGLRQGIRDGAMVAHYQPKIHLATGRCRSVEVLIRWQREDVLVYPDEFIPLAEEAGVIAELTEWVIETAALQAASWRDAGIDLRVAVNLSPMSLDDRFVERLVTAAEAHGLPASQIEVEITETALAENPDAVVTVVAQLAALGVDCAIDDFGTGYSSLGYLKHLPVAELKIDKSFVMNMPQDTRDQAIVASTVHMAHSLGLRTVAEGVENELVLRMLRRADCDIGQGYHWTRPVPADQLGFWLSKRSGVQQDAGTDNRAAGAAESAH